MHALYAIQGYRTRLCTPYRRTVEEVGARLKIYIRQAQNPEVAVGSR